MFFMPPATIVETIVSELDDANTHMLHGVEDREAMVQFHLTVGRALRNRFGLWNTENPFTHTGMGVAFDDPLHPDNLSGAILECVWDRVVGGIPASFVQDKLAELHEKEAS